MIATTYSDVYVAKIAMGADDMQTLRAFIEAEAYEGPSLILAYAHCIAHGIHMGTATDQQKAAVASGHRPLMRYNPALLSEGKHPLSLDSKPPTMKITDYALKEARYHVLSREKPEVSGELMADAQQDADDRWRFYEFLASQEVPEADVKSADATQAAD